MLSFLILSKWVRRMVTLLVLLGALVWFLPTILACTPLLSWLVNRAAKDVDGSLSVGSASLGWFYPVVLNDVSLKDRAGAPLASLAVVESEQTLLALALDFANPGRFVCDKAAIDVVIEKKCSNWERALAKLLPKKANPGSASDRITERGNAPPRLEVEVRSATVAFHDLDAKKQWAAGPVDVKVGLNQPGKAPLTVSATSGPRREYGCDIGPLDLYGSLDNGRLQFALAETTLNGGKLRLAGNGQLDKEPIELRFDKGVVIDHAQITPAMCAGGLGYAIPLLAGVTEAQGLVSLAVEESHISGADPAKAELRGTISLHSAQMTASPLVRELAGLLRGAAPTYQVKEMHVPVLVSGGRVHHQNFELRFGDFVVRTSGSVGFDGTVALVAEMPVPVRLPGNNPLSSALAHQTIRLPIGGTIDHPRLDTSALQAANAQSLQKTTSDVIRQGIDANLKRLFRER